MVLINGSTASGYFLYSGGTWSPAAVINATDLGGAVTSLFGLKAVGGLFYSLISLANGNFFIASFDTQWNPLVVRNTPSPDGNTVSAINGFDVNHNGDIAYIANLNGTGAIMVQSPDKTRMVFFASEPVTDTFWLRGFNNTGIDLRDDRTVYFTAWSLADEYALFMAKPLN